MKPELRFEQQQMMTSELGADAGTPDLVGSLILQNDLKFLLGEQEEIYEGYGRRTNSFPYRQYNSYNRSLKKKSVKTAVLENDFIKATFLPESGGRLWELIDKKSDMNLLYTNDVIRYSNLAVCNAWFSGGVEWNIGIIGHSPFTTEPLFTAELSDEDGNPVLRMYEYERIRGVEYQMDFWLGQADTFLNCRMRIVNTGKEVVPMYWWSNMAVPEFKGGRIVVPAEQAFTSHEGSVFKVDIPMVDGVDITRYETIPGQVDYFFDIPEQSPKFIVNLDGKGKGLLHLSTQRLKSRKLFSWGNNRGAARWQAFLTERAGRYVEIQAGLGKTQYGCIPMAPHTAWEWMEQYGPIDVGSELKDVPYETLRKAVEQLAGEECGRRGIEEKLRSTKKVALSPGRLVFLGKGGGALQQFVREFSGDRPMSPHLDYGDIAAPWKGWMEFLKTGKFMEAKPDDRPGCFMCESIFYDKLKETIRTKNSENWYAHYHLGVMHINEKNYAHGEQELKKALALVENPWAYHGLAALYILTGRQEEAGAVMAKGISMRKEDLGYVKEGFKLLMAAAAYEALLKIYEVLPGSIRLDSRLRFDSMAAFVKIGEPSKAQEMLADKFVLDDLREGEDSVSDLWKELYVAQYGKEPDEIPAEWDFNSMR